MINSLGNTSQEFADGRTDIETFKKVPNLTLNTIEQAYNGNLDSETAGNLLEVINKKTVDGKFSENANTIIALDERLTAIIEGQGDVEEFKNIINELKNDQ
jgi:hypothetical protein